VLEGAPKPTLEVFFGNENPEVLSPDYTPIEGRFEVERLGDGPAAMETSDVPRYADLLAAAGRHTGRDLSKLEAWRVHLDYPVHRSVARLWLTPSRHAAK